MHCGICEMGLELLIRLSSADKKSFFEFCEKLPFIFDNYALYIW